MPVTKLQVHCPHCGKVTEVTSEITLPAIGVMKTFACGHTTVEELIASLGPSIGNKFVCRRCLTIDPDPSDNCPPDSAQPHDVVEIPVERLASFARAFDYQKDGVGLLEAANFNCILGDEMGLGKTIQALQAVAHSKDHLTPTLYVVKSNLKLNWANEMVNNGWLCDRQDPNDYPFLIMEGGCAVIPGFRHYIISMSLLEKYKDQLAKIPFKLLVVDECQAFGNITAKRTKALFEIARAIPHRILISGTPILNRATEFWTALNLVKPDHWPSYASFVRNWIDAETTESGAVKLKGIKPWKRESFFARIKPYFIRRLKREVLKDLPPFSRHFMIVNIEDAAVRNRYNKEAAELEEFLNSAGPKGFGRSTTILGYLMRMRHMTEVAKVPLVIEHVVDFLENTSEDTKLIIGCHHDTTLRALSIGLASYNPVVMGSSLDDMERTRRIEEFKTPAKRILIAKILAQGEGINLQFCSNMLILTRMWNPGKEAQFEARIDRYGQTSRSVADYMVVKGSVEEVFTQIVEDKRRYVGETLDENYDFETDSELLEMLAERAGKLRMV